jgi:hypothetical protein
VVVASLRVARFAACQRGEDMSARRRTRPELVRIMTAPSIVISDEGNRAWRCDWCGRIRKGGRRIAGNDIEMCELCVRDIASTDADHLFEHWKADVQAHLVSISNAAGLGDLEESYSRWPLLSRWRTKLRLLVRRRRLEKQVDELSKPDTKRAASVMVNGCKNLARIIDESRERAQRGPL